MEFYEFCQIMEENQINESLNFLLEMPMRPAGRPDQYANKHVSPFPDSTATDNQTGRVTQRLKDQGKKLSRAAAAASWDKAVEERPELGVYSQAGQALRDDRKEAEAAQRALGLTPVTRLGGKVVQDGQKEKGPGDVEAIASTNRGESNLINQIYDLKTQMLELKNKGASATSKEMIDLAKQLYAATTIFTKRGMVGGPESEAIQKIHNGIAGYLLKLRSQAPDLNDV